MAVLLTPQMKDAIDVLFKVRDKVVSKDNPFVFARVFGDSKANLRGSVYLRRVVNDAGLESPERITGTQLWKYIATVSQIFQINDNELDWLARHLGHDIRVHRDFYRLQELAIELTKVSRLLIAVDEGKASEFKGKNLEEINLIGEFTITFCRF